MLKVVSSPKFSEEGLPWYFTGAAFKRWVWENILEEGSQGAFPASIREAVDIARSSGYDVIVAKKYIDPKPQNV